MATNGSQKIQKRKQYVKSVSASSGTGNFQEDVSL